MIQLDLKYQVRTGAAVRLVRLLFAVVFAVAMLNVPDIIRIIEDRDHLTLFISLSETPHEIRA